MWPFTLLKRTKWVSNELINITDICKSIIMTGKCSSPSGQNMFLLMVITTSKRALYHKVEMDFVSAGHSGYLLATIMICLFLRCPIISHLRLYPVKPVAQRAPAQHVFWPAQLWAPLGLFVMCHGRTPALKHCNQTQSRILAKLHMKAGTFEGSLSTKYYDKLRSNTSR